MTVQQDRREAVARLLALASEVEAERGFNNSLDVQCEIALFEQNDAERSIRSNAAGTKVIVTMTDGRDRTYLARDYTISAGARNITAAALRALASKEQQEQPSTR